MPSVSSRIAHAGLRARITDATGAAELIAPGTAVGMSGFTGAGYPKAVPQALARRIEAAHAASSPFTVRVWTGASTGPELDGALARAKGIEFRAPYNSDPVVREQINSGALDYCDLHLSEVAPMAREGFFGKLDT
ncbi:MAG TPA: propionyl-CoA--succinate CoA transferase, partial [Novosphingobium sp.]|nr:propionyl-CoA--succinate CoA transferase [Novosphingobium sp.]